MIYNTSYRFLQYIDPPSQEDVYNMPEYFAMSTGEVIASGCPTFLRNILLQMPWKDRPNVLQIRPQDFRTGQPPLLGDFWHIDNNVRLRDGKTRVAPNLDDFRLLVVSFGNVVETDFLVGPCEYPELDCTGANHPPIWQEVNQYAGPYDTVGPNQIAEYTSKDIHRMGRNPKLGRFRLVIIGFESSVVKGEGWKLPSIREKESGKPYPKFQDYIL